MLAKSANSALHKEVGAENDLAESSRKRNTRKILKPYFLIALAVLAYWAVHAVLTQQSALLPIYIFAAIGLGVFIGLFDQARETGGKIIIAAVANFAFFMIDLAQVDPAKDEYFYLIGLGGGFLLFNRFSEFRLMIVFSILPFLLNGLEEVISYFLFRAGTLFDYYQHFISFATVYVIVFAQFWYFARAANLTALDLSKALAELNQLFSLKSVFLSRTAHDLHNELASIRFVLLGMSGKRPVLTQETGTEMISTATDVLGGMIDDMVQSLSVEQGEVTLKPDLVETGPYFENLFRSALMGVSSKNCKARLVFDPWVPKTIMLDPLRMRQIVFNLTGNAIKYGVPQQPETLPLIGMHVGYDVDQEKIEVTISDNGPGVPSEMLERIFDHKFRLERDVNKQIRGTGIGLGSSRSLARQMQGDIVASRNEQGGMSFQINADAPVHDADPIVQAFGNGRLISCQCHATSEDTEFLRDLCESWGFVWEYGIRHAGTDFNPAAAVTIMVADTMYDARERLGREIQSVSLPVIFGLRHPSVYFVSPEQIFSISPVYPSELKREIDRAIAGAERKGFASQ